MAIDTVEPERECHNKQEEIPLQAPTSGDEMVTGSVKHERECLPFKPSLISWSGNENTGTAASLEWGDDAKNICQGGFKDADSAISEQGDDVFLQTIADETPNKASKLAIPRHIIKVRLDSQRRKKVKTAIT